MPLRVSSTYSSTIVIDGEVIPIKIKRLDPHQAIDFNRDFQRMGQSQRAGAVPADETEPARAARLVKGEDDERAAKTFVVSAISNYLTIEAGHILDTDTDKDVTQGLDLVRLYGARDDVLSELLFQIFMENKLNAEQKANWRIRLAPFVVTPLAVADRMMALAKVGPGDRVVDLGCGTGELCLAAARLGAQAIGYDIDADRVQQATSAASAANLLHLCTFKQQDALTVNIKDATVVSLYLLAGAHAKLRPVLLKELPDGARVVTHAFTMGGEWIPDQQDTVPLGDGEELAHSEQRVVYLYSVDRWRKAHAGPVAA